MFLALLPLVIVALGLKHRGAAYWKRVVPAIVVLWAMPLIPVDCLSFPGGRRVAQLVRGCFNVEDQPAHLRQRRRIETVPVEAVFQFLTSEHSPVRAFGGPAHLQELGI